MPPLRQVNEFFNRKIHFGCRYLGQAGHWATPLEVLGRSQGTAGFCHCEICNAETAGIPSERCD
jgi:hypothetical protein